MAKKNEVSVKGQFSKENVPAMLEMTNKKIKELENRFGGNEDKLSNDDLDGFGPISDITDVSDLIKAISSVQGRETGYKSAIKVADKTVTLTKYPFKLNGSSPSTWIKCINQRIGQITYQAEIDQLKKAASFLEKHVSDDMKFENDMAKFADAIGIK